MFFILSQIPRARASFIHNKVDIGSGDFLVITPIFISGSNTDPDKYRKVTVISALGKLFEIVLKIVLN